MYSDPNFDGTVLPGEWRALNLPTPIRAFMEKWQGIADAQKAMYRFGWPAKLVHTDFTYEGRRYRIVPETFGIPDDLCEWLQEGPRVTKQYGGGMDADLRAIPGVTDVFSDGFLD